MKGFNGWRKSERSKEGENKDLEGEKMDKENEG